jgi:hypothetical protein
MKNSDNGRTLRAYALIDSGATGNFVDEHFVVDHAINAHKLRSLIPVKNADGSENRAGPIKAYIDVWMTIQPPAAPKSHSERIQLEITGLASEFQVILGLPWLEEHNPSIDWQAALIDFDQCAHPTTIAVTMTLPTTRTGPIDSFKSTERPSRTLSTTQERRPCLEQDDIEHINVKALVRSAQWSKDSLSSRVGQTQDELPSPSYELQNTDWRHQLHQCLRVARTDHSRTTTVEDDMHKFVPEKYWSSQMFL